MSDHAVLLAGGAARRDPPAIRKCFAQRFDRKEDAPPSCCDLSLRHERNRAASPRSSFGGCPVGVGLSSRTIATHSQLTHANDLNPGRSSQSRISPPHFLQVIACRVRVVGPFAGDEMADPACERPPSVRMPPGSVGEPHRRQLSHSSMRTNREHRVNGAGDGRAAPAQLPDVVSGHVRTGAQQYKPARRLTILAGCADASPDNTLGSNSTRSIA
jgi:hypothetical protein